MQALPSPTPPVANCRRPAGPPIARLAEDLAGPQPITSSTTSRSLLRALLPLFLALVFFLLSLSRFALFVCVHLVGHRAPTPEPPWS